MAVSRFFTVSYRMHNGFMQDSQEVENGENQASGYRIQKLLAAHAVPRTASVR